jgi:hypothetical protein
VEGKSQAMRGNVENVVRKKPAGGPPQSPIWSPNAGRPTSGKLFDAPAFLAQESVLARQLVSCFFSALSATVIAQWPCKSGPSVSIQGLLVLPGPRPWWPLFSCCSPSITRPLPECMRERKKWASGALRERPRQAVAQLLRPAFAAGPHMSGACDN